MGTILKAIQRTLDEQGKGGRLLGTKKEVLETPRQAEYNDLRKIEKNYINGVHRTRQLK